MCRAKNNRDTRLWFAMFVHNAPFQPVIRRRHPRVSSHTAAGFHSIKFVFRITAADVGTSPTNAANKQLRALRICVAVFHLMCHSLSLSVPTPRHSVRQTTTVTAPLQATRTTNPLFSIAEENTTHLQQRQATIAPPLNNLSESMHR